MKQIASVRGASRKHWVGDGFYVSTMLSYNHQHDLHDPFLLLDYNQPYYFQAGGVHGVGEHPIGVLKRLRLSTKGRWRIEIRMEAGA
ncbi:pirin family protein [Helicobacter labacensis]|uniref:pirin family protein n=1 Tax=Helicobacter labacensis TaxID=2316079 RepID=UPI001F1BA715|nr:pirin family protein [Helicobacter labacensis]